MPDHTHRDVQSGPLKEAVMTNTELPTSVQLGRSLFRDYPDAFWQPPEECDHVWIKLFRSDERPDNPPVPLVSPSEARLSRDYVCLRCGGLTHWSVERFEEIERYIRVDTGR